MRRTAVTHKVGVLASGGTLMQDGSVQRYIAKTDSSGKTVQAILTGSFLAEHLCEAEDGTIWTLGREISGPPDYPDRRANVLRQFSFGKGLLRGYLPLGTVEAPVDSDMPWFTPFGSRLRCGRDKISAYLEFTDEYLEVDPNSFVTRRWKIDLSPVNHGKASGLAVTDDGRVYLSFGPSWRGMWSGISGLFEVKANSNSATAALLPVKGTLRFRSPPNPDKIEHTPPGTFARLWGADGNDLVVALADGGHVSWVRVLPVNSEGN